jgi:hypothetical protein
MIFGMGCRLVSDTQFNSRGLMSRFRKVVTVKECFLN